jgi:nitrogen-specific signal transduction histidine kinase
MVADMTERRRAQLEREQLEARLQQSQRLETVGQLAGGIAHDFNNLLAVILNYAYFVREQLPADSAVRTDIEEIRHAAERASELTHQLLVFSRRETVSLEVLDLNEVVREMERLLRRTIGEHVELKTKLADEPCMVKADAAQVEQVVLNLAVNARDAMPDGGTVMIWTRRITVGEEHVGRLRPGEYAVLAVSDDGPGMEREVVARAFEPFFTTKPKGKGTGLGLATVYGIVKQSGGYAWVYSELGQGTSVKIYLPRVDAPVEGSRPAPPTTGSLGGSETILVVEDQEEVRRLTRRILEARGYRVLVAASGPEALRLAEHEAGRIDLLVTDVVMPGMSGREVGLLLAPARPTMKVLYLSGYTDESIVHHGVLEPGVAFMQKPFNAEALARKVREVLG